MTQPAHFSVLLKESVDALIGDKQGAYVDGTFGRGGHSRAILTELGQGGRLIAFDKDPQAIAAAEALHQEDPRFSVEHASFVDVAEVAHREGLLGQVDGILLDLGVSSPQLDQAERGFSFMHDGPLDMRMDSSKGQSASEWVNHAAEDEMVRVFRDYGEERFARRMARAIIARRSEVPFTRTKDLADVITAANPKWEREKHPATRAFQAIRIEVNSELRDLERVLTSALDVLKPGGRLVVISFHSLEDRIVKRFFKAQARGKQFPKGIPVTDSMLEQTLILVGKAVKASEQEVQANRRSRSAVMRVAEKIRTGNE